MGYSIDSDLQIEGLAFVEVIDLNDVAEDKITFVVAANELLLESDNLEAKDMIYTKHLVESLQFCLES